MGLKAIHKLQRSYFDTNSRQAVPNDLGSYYTRSMSLYSTMKCKMQLKHKSSITCSETHRNANSWLSKYMLHINKNNPSVERSSASLGHPQGCDSWAPSRARQFIGWSCLSWGDRACRAPLEYIPCSTPAPHNYQGRTGTTRAYIRNDSTDRRDGTTHCVS